MNEQASVRPTQASADELLELRRCMRDLVALTGLPVTIGALELAWHPVPCLSAHEVAIGTGEFLAVTKRVDVFPRLAPLLDVRDGFHRLPETVPVGLGSSL